jgi:pimeloyl-ACP methyl ester carboxylesterase
MTAMRSMIGLAPVASSDRLHVVTAGDGRPVVLLHGLTATHRYVLMGSKHLERSGHRVVAYDARGHGRSEPAPEPGAYAYVDLVADLVAVLDDEGLDRVVLAGASMGAHTALRCALEWPERVAGLVVVTPAYDAATAEDPAALAGWDRLADGLAGGGVDGFVAAYDLDAVPEAFRPTVETVLRQRLAQHEHPLAVAEALRVVPRSRPFPDLGALAAITVPTVVVGDRDEADPGHSLAVAEAYARTIPDAELVVEDPGRSPIAWQGGQLSKVVAGLAARAAWG